MEGNSKKIIVVGGISDKSMWVANNGKSTIREQDFVIWGGGLSMAIPSSYAKHPFKILICRKK